MNLSRQQDSSLEQALHTGNQQQALDVDSPVQGFRSLPASPQNPRFRNVPAPKAPRFRYVPEYTGQQEIVPSEEDEKLKAQAKDQLAKELSDEFDNQLQSERDRLSNAKRSASAASAMRVGYKM